MEYTRQPVYDIISIVRIRYYTETTIQIFKTYTETRIRCYIGIMSRILTDSYRVNKREYGFNVFTESLYNEYGKIIQKIYRKILFCIELYSVLVRGNAVQKNPYSQWFCVVSVSIHKRSLRFLTIEMFKIMKGTAPTLVIEMFPLNEKIDTNCEIVLILQL